MCRHCERITKHPEDKPTVHVFMELVAKRLSELRGEPVQADALDVQIGLTMQEWQPNPLFGTDAANRARRLLDEMYR